MTVAPSKYDRIANECSVEGCDRASDCKGMCSAHYRSQIRASAVRTNVGSPWAYDVSDEVTADILQAFRYDPDSGFFFWKNSNRPSKNGFRADFSYIHGHRAVSRKQQHYFAHRVAWLHMTGQWPKCQIDHINRVRDDNRFCNLREADNAQNNVNRPATAKSSTGIKGVYWKKSEQKWLAQITVSGKSRHLGYFDSKDGAAAAYAGAAQLLHGEFLHPSTQEDAR